MEKVTNILESIPYLLKMPSNRTWVDYDDDADVLYIYSGRNIKREDVMQFECHRIAKVL